MIIKVPKGTSLFICGDIHEHEVQFDKLLNEINPNATTWFASVGDIYDKGDGIDAAERIVDKIRHLVDKKIGFVVKGNHELKHLRLAKRHGNPLSPQLKWIEQQPTAIMFEFYNRSRVLMVHGGVTPKHTLTDVLDDIETSYVRWIDEDGKSIPLRSKKVDGVRTFYPAKEGRIWHETYDGRFGYVVSGHFHQEDGKPKFYNYSCNLDSACFHTGKLTAQEFTDMGTKGKTIIISGNAKHPNLQRLYN